MQNWLEVFKFPSVERSTYDRCECTANHQIYPSLGGKIVSDVTAADIKDLLNQKMQEGYAYTTVKKVYVILGEYFRYLTQQEIIVKNLTSLKSNKNDRPSDLPGRSKFARQEAKSKMRYHRKNFHFG